MFKIKGMGKGPTRCSLGRMLMSLTNATLSGQFSLATDRPDCSVDSPISQV